MSDDYELRSVSEGLASEWSAFVAAHDDATAFHTSAWAASVETVFGYEPRRFLVYETGGGDPIAAVPGFVVADPPGRSIVNPFCEYGFPLIDSRVRYTGVLKALKPVTDRLSAYVLKDTPWSGVSGYAKAEYGAVRTGSAIRLKLDDSYTDLWEADFERDVRRCVRMAENKGLAVAEGTIEEFYPIYYETMRRLGSPQFPQDFFDALRDQFGENATVLLAREGEHERPIGGVLLLEWGDTTIIWSVASKQAYWEYRPTHLLYARAIERACRNDQSVVDLGRSRSGSSVHEFKSQFGGVAYPLVSFVTPPHRTPRASLEGYGQLSGIAQRLAPLITHPMVGPRLKGLIHE